MKKTIGIVIFLVLAAAIIFGGVLIGNGIQEKKCREYEEYVAGRTLSGFDSTQTTNHGKVSYRYTLVLQEDGTCTLKVSCTRTGDKGAFANNGTTKFELTEMRWSVRCSGGEYEIFLSGGDWDWQDWSAAKISRYISITDYGDGDIYFKGIRSGHYDFYFNMK